MKKYVITIVCILVLAGGIFGVSLVKNTDQRTQAVTNRSNAGLIVTDERVFDLADLLSDTEEAQLMQQIERVREEMHTDIVLLTTNDAEGKSSMEYADDFYDTHDFGYEDSHGTGILFLIDMDNRCIWFSTSGDCISYYTSERIDTAIDSVYSQLKAGAYYQVFSGCIDSVERYMYQSHNSYLPVCLLIALVIMIVFVAYLLMTRGGKVTVNADTYLVAASKEIYEHEDIHYDTVVTTRIIQSSGGSGGGGHTSSGGFSHGGGGRSF